MYLGLLPYWKKKGCSIPKVGLCNKFKHITLACGGAGNLISKKIFYNKNYFSASVQDGPKNELERSRRRKNRTVLFDQNNSLVFLVFMIT